MAYGPEWDPYRADEVRARAEARWNRQDTSLGFLYRFDATTYSVIVDAEREEYSTNTKLELYAYPVVRHTPKGVVIQTSGPICGNQTRWVSNHTRKRFALPTVELARESFIARKTKQAGIYEARAKHARWLAEKAEGKNNLLTQLRSCG